MLTGRGTYPGLRGRARGRGRGGRAAAPEWTTHKLSASRPGDVLVAAATLDFAVVEEALSAPPESRARLARTRSGHGHSLVHMLLFSCRFEKIGEITHQVEWPDPNRTIFRQDFADGVARAIRPLLARTLRLLPELVSAPTTSGLSPLHVAAEIGSTVLVAELLRAGAANDSAVVAPGAAEERGSLGARQHRRRQLRRLAEEQQEAAPRQPGHRRRLLQTRLQRLAEEEAPTAAPPDGQQQRGGGGGDGGGGGGGPSKPRSKPYLSALRVATNSGSRRVTRAILDALPDATPQQRQRRAEARRGVERLMALAGHPLAREGSAKPRVDPPPRERRGAATCAEGGGWDVAEPPSEEARPTACDLDQRTLTEMSADEWYRDYFLHNRPVVIRGVLPLSMRCRCAPHARAHAPCARPPTARARGMHVAASSPWCNQESHVWLPPLAGFIDACLWQVRAGRGGPSRGADGREEGVWAHGVPVADGAAALRHVHDQRAGDAPALQRRRADAADLHAAAHAHGPQRQRRRRLGMPPSLNTRRRASNQRPHLASSNEHTRASSRHADPCARAFAPRPPRTPHNRGDNRAAAAGQLSVGARPRAVRRDAPRLGGAEQRAVLRGRRRLRRDDAFPPGRLQRPLLWRSARRGAHMGTCGHAANAQTG